MSLDDKIRKGLAITGGVILLSIPATFFMDLPKRSLSWADGHYMIMSSDVKAHLERRTYCPLEEMAGNVTNYDLAIADLLESPDKRISYCK